MAVQDYELLLRVRADLLEAVSGLKGLTTQLGEGDAAAKQLGESADQASARINAMVQSSLAQQKAMEGSNRATIQAAAASQRVVISANEEIAATTRARAATEAYRATSVSSGAQAAASLELRRSAMAKLAGQIDPTVAAMARLDAQERSLNALRKAGAVGIDDYTRFKSVIDANRLSITGAATAMHGFNLNTQQTRLEMGRMIKDISTGQYGRLASSGTTLANQAGFISLLFSGTGLAIAAVVGSLGAFAVAALKGAQDTDTFNKSIAQTGNYAGVTAGQLETMAHQITGANGSVSDSRIILNALTASGKVSGQSLQALGQAAADMAALTGMSAEEAAKAVLKMFDGTAAGALKANEQYKFLTTGIYDQIKALEDQGDTQGAIDVEARALHAAALERQRQLQDDLSVTASWWDKIKKKAGDAWEAMKSNREIAIQLGLANDQQQIDELLERKRNATPDARGNLQSFAGVISNMMGKGFGAPEQAQLDALQAKVAKAATDAKDAGTSQQLNGAAVTADAGLDRLSTSIDKAYAKKEKIKELNKYFTDLWAGADPNNAKLNGVQRFVADDGSISYSGGLYDTLLADINKAPKGAGGRKGRSQESIDQSAAAAQQQLIEALGQVQGKLDPTAAAWAEYNKQVDKANKLAATAKTGSKANIDAINGERDAYIAGAAAVRDAAIAKEADKDREAYEKLRDSIKDVDNVTLGKAFAQLKQLNDELARGTITRQEHDDTSSAVIDANIPKSLKYKGLDAVVGGPFGEMDKADKALAAQQENYRKQLDALNKFHDAKLQSDADFVKQENALQAANAEQVQEIQDAKQKALLMGLTASFAAGAEAIKQGFGEQSKEYRAAFTLSKAAAIAMATINMYQDISQASAKGWPQNIPLIAMAIGEGMSILGSIRSISAGYSEGGYTGAGGVNQPAGVVHAGEVVFSQRDVARHGGPQMVEAMRLGFRGYAEGGIVGAFASPKDFPQAANGSMESVLNAGAPASASQPNKLRVYVLQNEDQLAQRLAQHPAMEKAVVAIAGENGTAIRAEW
ncbi:MAG: phage tail length tape measure family protein [Rhodanobacter sp.]